MEQFAYCKDRVLVPGSHLAMMQSFLDTRLLPDLIVLEALYQQLIEIPMRVQDPSVALSKLGWWQEEIQRCWQGAPRHPVTVAACKQALPEALPEAEVLMLVHSIGPWLKDEPIASLADLSQQCQQLGGRVAMLGARLCGVTDSGLESFAALGGGRQLTSIIGNLRLDAGQGRWYVPLELEARHQYGKEQAAKGLQTDGFDALVLELTDAVRTLLALGMSQASDQQAVLARHVILQSALDEHLCQKMATNPGIILSQKPLHNAISALWLLWRRSRQIMQKSTPDEQETRINDSVNQ